jgi:predicted phosphoribosyltransferase
LDMDLQAIGYVRRKTMFFDRADAGRKLGQALCQYAGRPVVVYALPRGGVVTGIEVASILAAPLDLIVVRKVGHPRNPEYAVAAVAEDGYLIANPDEVAGLDQNWFERAVAAELNEARRRRAVFLEGRRSVPVAGRTAIVVDDGLATGLTMKAAVHAIRQRGPSEIVVAVPVAAAETAEELRPAVDQLVVLHIPDGWFGSVGSYYRSFDQVSDDEVVALMKSFSSVETR